MRITKSGRDLIVWPDDGPQFVALKSGIGLWVASPEGGSTPVPPDGNLPDSLTVTAGDGTTITLQRFQLEYAQRVYSVANPLAGRQGTVIAFMTIFVESVWLMYANSNVPESLNYPHDAVGSDHDSVGLYQQRPSFWGGTGDLMDVEWSTRAFIGGTEGPNNGSPRGLLDIPGWQDMGYGEAAQAVQVSAFPDRYDNWRNASEQVFDVVSGAGSGKWEWPFIPRPYTEGGDMPAPGSQDAIWAEYGPRSGIGVGGFHEGIDFGYGTALNGAEIRAAGSGTVYSVGPAGGYGNLIRLDHADGTSTNYAHWQDGSARVSVGDTVNAGDVIALIGGTGGVAPHLHFETHETPAGEQVNNTADNGGYRSAVDPRAFMGARV